MPIEPGRAVAMHLVDTMTDYSEPHLEPVRADDSTWRQVVRTRVFEVAILLWSLPFAILICTLFQLWRPPALVRRALRLWSTGFIECARWIVGVRYRIEGLGHVPRHPVIFVCNHQSYWESIALTAILADVNVVSKGEAMDIPVFGWGLRHAPMIAVFRNRRGTNLRRILREGLRTLTEGRSVLIFPEGTRVRPGARRRFERGFESLYRHAGTEIVPVVHNAGLCWTRGFEPKWPGVITLRFCPPIARGLEAQKAAATAECTINEQKDRLLDPAASM